MEFKTQLKQLGLPERETKVLQFLLYSGDTSPSLIAKELGISRSTVYDILNNLFSKGLVTKKIIQKGKFSFQVTPPKHWISHWLSKEDRIQEQKKILLNMIPDLEMAYEKSARQPRIIFYEGEEGIKRVALDSLEAVSQEIVGYSAVSQVVKFLDSKFIAYYAKEKIKREIKSRFVLRGPEESAPLIKQYIKKYYSGDKSGKYIPRYRFYIKGRHTMKNEIMIYDDKIVIMNIVPPHFFATLIQNKDMTDGQRAIFEIAWQSSKAIN